MLQLVFVRKEERETVLVKVLINASNSFNKIRTKKKKKKILYLKSFQYSLKNSLDKLRG